MMSVPRVISIRTRETTSKSQIQTDPCVAVYFFVFWQNCHCCGVTQRFAVKGDVDVMLDVCSEQGAQEEEKDRSDTLHLNDTWGHLDVWKLDVWQQKASYPR